MAPLDKMHTKNTQNEAFEPMQEHNISLRKTKLQNEALDSGELRA